MSWVRQDPLWGRVTARVAARRQGDRGIHIGMKPLPEDGASSEQSEDSFDFDILSDALTVDFDTRSPQIVPAVPTAKDKGKALLREENRHHQVAESSAAAV